MLNSLLMMATEQAITLAGASALSALLGFALAFMLFKRPDFRDEAQLVADNTEAAEAIIRRVSVVAAEVFGERAAKAGFDKLIFAADVFEAAFASVGIKGDPARANWSDLYQRLRDTAKQLFPVHSTKPPAPPAA